jgi:hypothetical protein
VIHLEDPFPHSLVPWNALRKLKFWIRNDAVNTPNIGSLYLELRVSPDEHVSSFENVIWSHEFRGVWSHDLLIEGKQAFDFNGTFSVCIMENCDVPFLDFYAKSPVKLDLLVYVMNYGVDKVLMTGNHMFRIGPSLSDNGCEGHVRNEASNRSQSTAGIVQASPFHPLTTCISFPIFKMNFEYLSCLRVSSDGICS